MAQRTRIAVVGFGLIGRRHAEVIRRSPEMELSAIVDPSEDSRNAAEQLETRAYADLGEMIATDRPDGIVLATPTPLHIEQGLQCIDAGVPILIEKPIGLLNAFRLSTTTVSREEWI